MVGEMLSNRYEIVAKIGDGGMALVYSAKDTLLNRLVAVKILREQYATDKQFIERFHQEAQAAASLSHPNVVNVYDVGEIGKTPFIVMEYVEGKTLSEIISEQGKLTPQYTVAIGLQICSALAHAHKQQIVHRDIKPHNILITKDNQVKVTDFGIAAISSMSITQTGVVLGSVLYFSPEQARGSKADQQSDLYSLGVVFYEMLCGLVPFRGDTPISIALKHIQESPKPLSELNPQVVPDLERVVLKLLAKKPADRFSTAMELSKKLEKISFKPMHDQTQKMVITKESEEPLRVPNTKKRVKQKNRVPLIIISILVLAGLFYGIMELIPGILFPDDVRVPNVVGMTVEEAETELSNHRLKIAIDIEVFDNEVPKNHIISQDPKPERMKKENQYVLVRVSKGPEYIEMPSVLGELSREAQLILTQTGFTLGDLVPETSEEYPINTVISQEPSPGEEVPLGIAVDLVISQGLDTIATVVLPDFRGKELDDVRWQLADLGLNEGNVIPEYSTTVERNRIVEQNPPANTEVEIGWSIDLVYSQGLPGEEPISSADDVQRWTTDGIWQENEIRIEIPEGRSQEVAIVVVDDFGAREVYREIHSGGSSFGYTVQGRGEQARIQVYIGGRLFIDRYFRE